MTKSAIKYKDIITSKILDAKLNIKNKYYFTSSYIDYTFNLRDSDWYESQFVSVDSNNNVIGYFSFNYNREINSISSITIISFIDKNNPILIRDVYNKIIESFEYGFTKLNFSVCIGNPIEKSYDKFVKLLNGRIVGIFKNEFKLIDGKLYDKKCYEILKWE